MNRADRLEALLALLRARDEVTAAELAAHFEVSERTIFRDLDALRARGLPIEGEPGRGGGVRLLPHGALPAIRLSLDEAAALALSLGLARQGAGLPFSGAASRAMDRVLGALPPARRRELRRVLERIVVGPPATERVARGAGSPAPGLVELVEGAFTAGEGLRFRYVDRHREETRRCVEPHGFLLQWPVWYLLAWDIEKAAPRMFRMDRISEAERRPEIRFLPRPVEVVEALAAPVFEPR